MVAVGLNHRLLIIHQRRYCIITSSAFFNPTINRETIMIITMKHKRARLNQHLDNQIEQQAFSALSDTPALTVGLDFNYQTAFSMLETHQQQLHALIKVDDKIALKQKIVPQYLSFLNDYLDSGAQYKNDVLTTLTVWLIDIEDLENALKFAELAIEQQQLSPAKYKRDMPSLIAEMICDWAERQYKAKQSAYPYFDRVVALVESEQWIMSNVIIPNKIYKQVALFAERAQDFKTAVEYFEKCIEVNPDKHGVKTKLEFARKKLDLTK